MVSSLIALCIFSLYLPQSSFVLFCITIQQIKLVFEFTCCFRGCAFGFYTCLPLLAMTVCYAKYRRLLQCASEQSYGEVCNPTLHTFFILFHLSDCQQPGIACQPVTEKTFLLSNGWLLEGHGPVSRPEWEFSNLFHGN